MPTSTLSIKYRPTKIGFLVNNDSEEEFLKAVRLNTMLWGGIFNPIIPVTESNSKQSQNMINTYGVDVLFAVGKSSAIDAIVEKNKFLKCPKNFTNQFFYEEWRSKKNTPTYLSVENAIDLLWDKEFKNKATNFTSNFMLPTWTKKNPNNSLLTVLFGQFPDDANTKTDFKKNYLEGLKAQEVNFDSFETIPKEIDGKSTPLNLGELNLTGYGGNMRGGGVYMGNSNNLCDLINFWNLRACGHKIKFFPTNLLNEFKEFIEKFIERLDNAPNRHPNIPDHITFYTTSEKDKEIIKEIKTNKQQHFYDCNSYIPLEPLTLCFNWQNTLANIEQKGSSYHVSASLPEKKFIPNLNLTNRWNIDSQSLVVDIDPIGEFAYPKHTLNPPSIRELNEFYSREMAIDPWAIRSSSRGVSRLIDVGTDSISLYPISHKKIIKQILKSIGEPSTISQAGLLAERIITKMRIQNPLDACRVFKIPGVRKLLSSDKIKNGKSIKWSEATKMIWQNKKTFNKFLNLYIEARDDKHLGTNDVFNFLLKKKILKPKLNLIFKVIRKEIEFKCKDCGLKSKILISAFETLWECVFCEHKHFMPEFIVEEFSGEKNRYFTFQKTGFFAKENNQEGSIPVILGLLAINRVLNGDFLYTTSLELKNAEVDFCILDHSSYHGIQIGIGECKSSGVLSVFTKTEIKKMKAIQDKLRNIGIKCYLIFVKTSDAISSEQLALLQELKNQGREFIILSNMELEPYYPYEYHKKKDKAIEKCAVNLEDMYRNTLSIYF